MTLQTHQEPSTDSSADTSPSERRCVLVVDDNESVTRALTSILKRSGYCVRAYQHGLKALDYAQAHADIVAAVVDVHLPDISGLIVAKALRETLAPGTPIIVVSGDTSMENLNALHHVGASYFFSKPLQPQQLLTRLREWLG